MPNAGGSRTAVIVDSVPLLRIGLERVFYSAGVRVLLDTADPLEGVVRITADRPDLAVFGDLLGATAETVRRVKALPVAPRVAVLVGVQGREELTSLLGAGADGLLVRSIDPDDLRGSLDRLLHGERVVSPSLLPALVGMVEVTGSVSSDGVSALTAKEREVLARLANGSSNEEIASALFVSAATVKTHLAHIYGKLGARSRHEALARAVALGILG